MDDPSLGIIISLAVIGFIIFIINRANDQHDYSKEKYQGKKTSHNRVQPSGLQNNGTRTMRVSSSGSYSDDDDDTYSYRSRPSTRKITPKKNCPGNSNRVKQYKVDKYGEVNDV